MALVYANDSTLITKGEHAGATIVAGTAWEEDDPIVRLRPDLFDASPPQGVHTSDGIERATARPGERRNVRRAR